MFMGQNFTKNQFMFSKYPMLEIIWDLLDF